MRFVKQAFTLIELLLGMLLLSLLVTLIVHQFSCIRGYVHSEVHNLYQACLYMQRHALMTRKDCSLIFNLDRHNYTFNKRTYRLPSGVKFGILPAYGPPSSPHKAITKACTFKDNEITFYADGIIESGSIYVTDARHTILYALTVPVASYSYLRTYCYDDGTWRLLQ